MSDNFWNDLQYMVLGRDDRELFTQVAYAGVLAINRPNLIARLFNPTYQSLMNVIQILPRLWGLSSRVHGRILNDKFVQFCFLL